MTPCLNQGSEIVVNFYPLVITDTKFEFIFFNHSKQLRRKVIHFCYEFDHFCIIFPIGNIDKSKCMDTGLTVFLTESIIRVE